ncbi:MAG: hypothetical protein LBL90_01915 [Prevotellaceae bacterium]|jgi:hypothetical protein|nr:hypothetical protein [Prevotellaceae bacterium]
MKKLLFLLIIPFLAVACSDSDDSTELFVDYYTIRQNEWIRVGEQDQLNTFYMSPAINIPQLSNYVYDAGAVMVYMEIDGKFHTPLPYTIYNGEINEFGKRLWSALYDYEYTPGFITFYSTLSDFYDGGQIPPTTTFKVVFLWKK